MEENDFSKKIDVTSELMKMGINIVVPQVVPKKSLKTLNEADFLDNNDKLRIKDVDEDLKTEGKNNRRRKKKENSPQSLPLSNSMFSTIQTTEEKQPKREHKHNRDSKKIFQNKNKDDSIDPVIPQSQIHNQRYKQNQVPSNNQDKNPKIKVN
jgi:hypothetical protein